MKWNIDSVPYCSAAPSSRSSVTSVDGSGPLAQLEGEGGGTVQANIVIRLRERHKQELISDAENSHV